PLMKGIVMGILIPAVNINTLYMINKILISCVMLFAWLTNNSCTNGRVISENYKVHKPSSFFWRTSQIFSDKKVYEFSLEDNSILGKTYMHIVPTKVYKDKRNNSGWVEGVLYAASSPVTAKIDIVSKSKMAISVGY